MQLTRMDIAGIYYVQKVNQTSKMDNSIKPRSIDALVFDGMNLLDLAGPVEAFNHARVNGKRAYRTRYVSLDGEAIRTSCGLRILPDAKLSALSRANDLLLPGGTGVDRHFENQHLKKVIAGWHVKRHDGRLISICSGAVYLAAAGVLNGRAATTHWSRQEMVLKLFPNVHWDLNKIYILSDKILTSAGVSTGIDLALAIIRQDCGAARALDVAQELVVYLQRSGGQSQFSGFLSRQYNLDGRLSRLVDAILEAPEIDWKLDSMAEKMSMNSRTLSRRFSAAMRMSPVRFVEQVRLDLARQFLSSGMPLKRAAVASGFGDIQRMRRSFQRQVGLNPEDYAERFGERKLR